MLTNIDAYDDWPSAEERVYLKLIVNPLTSPWSGRCCIPLRPTPAVRDRRAPP